MKWSHGLKALPELASAALLLALWIEPQRAIAGAVLYFTLKGLSRPYFARAQKP